MSPAGLVIVVAAYWRRAARVTETGHALFAGDGGGLGGAGSVHLIRGAVEVVVVNSAPPFDPSRRDDFRSVPGVARRPPQYQKTLNTSIC